jgi:uncharacterized protein
VKKQLLSLSRTLHIYLTMFGLLVLLLFGVTGFTINHEEWFGATRPRVTESEGVTPVALIASADALRVVEHLRSTFRISGAMTDYDVGDDKLSIAFKEPGQVWEIEIDKASGRTRIHAEAFNLAAVLNNLHRGRYAGRAWSWVIDLSALLIVLACVTGIVLWLALPRRRTVGLIALGVGLVGTVGVFYVLVPGADAPRPVVSSAPAGGR